MSVQQFLAESLGKAIAGGVEFAAMKNLVSDMEAQDLPARSEEHTSELQSH